MIVSSIFVCLILSAFNFFCSALDEAPVVTISLGRVEGSLMKSFRGDSIYAYRGIPYAQPPIGKLRFAAPQPIETWANEILNATSNSPICPQTMQGFNIDENCLTLNVYTKQFEQKLPVIVYIHGGGNELGAGHSNFGAGPQYLMDYEVVYVSLNYRLGAFGFLKTSGSNVKGNFAYLDQLLVLKWVKEHIENFGGDSDNVTLMGISAGAMAVSLHLASPLSQNLFHRAILMSGSSTNHFKRNNAYWTQKLAKEVSCPMFDPVDVVECLRNVTWQEIIEVSARFSPYAFGNIKWNFEIDDYFMPEHPTELIEKGQFNKIPLLVSYTANELDYSLYKHLTKEYLLDDLNVNFNKYAPEMFFMDYDPNKSQRLKNFYLGQNVNQINEENIEEFGKIFSDGILGHGIFRLVDLARHYTNVYYTRMDYVGQRSGSAPLNVKNVYKGVAHGDDLQYIMPRFIELMATNDTDLFMMERITEWFTHFAKTGAPMSSIENWPPCNSTHINLLYNDAVTKVGLPAYSERYAIWDELFPTPGNAKGGAVNMAGRQLNVIVIAIVIATGVASWQLWWKLM